MLGRSGDFDFAVAFFGGRLVGTLEEIGSMSISMNVKDIGRHNKPHIHCEYASSKASVDFEGKVLAGRLPPRQLRELREWIKANRRTLDEAWELAVNNKRFEHLFDEVREAGVMYGVETKAADVEEYADDEGEYIPYSSIVALRILPAPGYRIWARFSTGEEIVYDFTSVLGYEVFTPMRDRAFFDRGYLDHSTVCWDTGRGVRRTTLGFWDEGIIDPDQFDILENGVPTPESALTPEERARPVMDKERSADAYMERCELYKFFENRLSEEEYHKFCEKFRGVWDPRELLRAEKERFLRLKVA